MKRVIAIINDYGPVQEEYINSGTGGSETWIIEISKQFSKHGYYVMVFSTDSSWINYDSGVEYLPISLLEYKICYIKFDHIIICRYVKQDTLDLMSKYINNINKISWMIHDTQICINYKLPKSYKEIINNTCLKLKFHKFIYLSNFGKLIIQHQIPGIPDDKFVLIGNGINFNYNYDNLDIKDNNFLWSSRYERGLELFVNDIFPYIKKEYPESKIYVAQYENNLPENLLNNENIIFLGKLSKEELYKEMSKHKVAFYPNFYPETFCITILENILCGNDLVTCFKYGPATTLRYFRDLMLSENVNYENKETCENISKIIINLMKNYYNINNKNIRNIMRNYILEEYSWENIYNKFELYILN